AIDEHQWRTIIGEREAAEFLGIESAIIVVANDATDHHENTERVYVCDQAAQRVRPVAHLPTLIEVEAERRSNGRGSCLDVAFEVCGADKGQRRIASRACEVAIPFLALLAEIDQIEEVRGRILIAPVTSSSEVRDGHALGWRLWQHQIVNPRV